MPIYEYVCMKCESHFEEAASRTASNRPVRTAVRRRCSSSSPSSPPTAPTRRRASAGRSRRRLLRRRLRLRPLKRGGTHGSPASPLLLASRGPSHVRSGESVVSPPREKGVFSKDVLTTACNRSCNSLPVRHLPKLRAVLHAVPDSDPGELDGFGVEASACTRCRLHEGRTQVVFGAGNPDADLMFVGEAPGFHEDQQGVPFVGQAGKLLDRAARGDRPHARRRLHRERAQVPPAGQPRPAARRDRGLRAAPLPPDRADPADGDRHARQLRDEAPLRQAARDHARARAAEQEIDARRIAGARSTRSSIRPPRSTRRRCSRCSRRTSGGAPRAARPRERRAPAGADLAARPSRRPSRGRGVQLGLF